MLNVDVIIENYLPQFRSGNTIPVERAVVTRKELIKLLKEMMS